MSDPKNLSDDELKASIIEKHGNVINCERQATEQLKRGLCFAKEVGDFLCEFKARNEGHFEERVRAEFPFCIETARLYMRISRQWDAEIKPKFTENPDLSIEAARQLLKVPRGSKRASKLNDSDNGQLLLLIKQRLDEVQQRNFAAWLRQDAVFDRIWDMIFEEFEKLEPGDSPGDATEDK